MEFGKIVFPEISDHREGEVLSFIIQPVTATQLSRWLGISFEECNYELRELESEGLVTCLNSVARRNRLFWITDLGKELLGQVIGTANLTLDFPDIDWDLYASVCFSQRSEVIRTLSSVMRPSKIKRRASFLKPGLRLSANNVRDVICYLKKHGIVVPVALKKQAHPGYELTEMGLHMRRLLLRLEGSWQ